MRQSERLWHLARSYGMGEWFMAVWVEGLEVWEVARRMGVSVVDVDDAVECTWGGLREELSFDGGPGVIWAGRLNENWTQIIQARGFDCDGALRELSYGGRALLVRWDWDGPHDLEYAVDGNYATGFSLTTPGKRWGDDPYALDPFAQGLQFDVTDPSWESDLDLPPGWLEYTAWEEARIESGRDYGEEDDVLPPEWEDCMQLAHSGYRPSLATCITSALTLVGRVTGREFDKEWMHEPHTRYVLPG
ncbi:hypothetical protein [Streptosporangium sp. NBC_01469]|uniref:hypothetical protein n=1 Tax=Streptosporangium sp. NBC_01469 TaxID=2903898 RepID=UPI002E2A1A19|nr:hypothetical protein [Streptosporangium sp. NBC_01469]